MEKDNIEQLLMNTFEDYAVPEFKNSWPRIKSEVFRKQFFKFNLYHFNAYYGIVAVATILTAGILFFSPSEPEKVRPVPLEVEDVLEAPAGEDTISAEGHLEQVPEIREMDKRSEEVLRDVATQDKSVVIEKNLVPERGAEDLNDPSGLKTDAVSIDELEEGKVDNDGVTSVLDEDSLVRVLEGDSSKMEVLTPLAPIETIALEQDLDTLSGDELKTDRKKVIVVEPPVVKRDTVVKVIRERRRR